MVVLCHIGVGMSRDDCCVTAHKFVGVFVPLVLSPVFCGDGGGAASVAGCVSIFCAVYAVRHFSIWITCVFLGLWLAFALARLVLFIAFNASVLVSAVGRCMCVALASMALYDAG